MQKSEKVLSKGFSIFKEEIIPKGEFKKRIVEYLFSGDATHTEIFEEMRKHHSIEKSAFTGHPKEYSIQIGAETVIFSVY